MHTFENILHRTETFKTTPDIQNKIYFTIVKVVQNLNIKLFYCY